MLRVTFKNLLARKFRLLLTSIAVMLGVAFMAGTFVLTDTLGNVFDGLFADVNRGVDVAVRPKEPFEETAGGPGTQVVRTPLDESVLTIVEQVDGVSQLEGTVGGLAEVVALRGENRGDTIRHGQAPNLLVTWGPNRELNRVAGGDGEPEHGERPNASGEVALDEVTAADAGLKPRDVERCATKGTCKRSTVRIVPISRHEPDEFRVVGIFKFGTVGNLAGATLAAFTLDTAQELLNKEGKLDQINVKAAPGVSAVELRDRVRQALRAEGVSRAEVLTGKQLAADQSDEIRQNLQFFNIFLLVFALIALFVGAFIIYNTFAIIVAQRTHELGLLRALGASGRQVTGSVTVEALVVGLLSSVLGLVAGVGVAIGLQEMLKAFDVQLPSGDTVILARTVFVSLIVGTLVTVVSTIAPARRAARVSPVAAMQGDAHTTGGSGRYVVGGALALVGAIALAVGLFVDVEGVPGGAAAVVGIAAAMVFVGVAMLSPLVARPVSEVLGSLPARFRGVAGVLARENATRNPRRTATTAAALMVGIALMTLVAIIGASIRSTFSSILEDDFHAEFVLRTENFFPFSPDAAVAVKREIPESKVTEFRFGNFAIAGETKAVLGVDTNLGASIDIHPEAGALATFRERGGFLVFEDAFRELPARQRTAGVLNVRFPEGGRQEVPIAGVFRTKDAIGNDFLLAMPDFEANYADEAEADAFAAVKIPEGLSIARAGKLIDRALKPYPSVKSEDQEEFQESQEAQVGQFLNLINVLLGLAVVIAILGIMNTLALSIYERTHELGLLRAVGMSRSQLRRMVRYESIIIAVFGSALGIALGLVLGRALVAALESEGINFALSITGLLTLILLGLFGGWIASVLPARRAARLDILRAVHTE